MKFNRRVMIAILGGAFLTRKGQGAIAPSSQIMKADDIARINSHLPIVEEGYTRDALLSPNGVWYDTKSMGVCIQAGTGPNLSQEFQNPVGLFDDRPRLGIANGDQPGTIANHSPASFPWMVGQPGGTSLSDNVSNVKRVVWPLRPDGKRVWPIVVFPTNDIEGFTNPNQRVRGVDWCFPLGGMLLEMFTTNDFIGNQHYTCVVRSRRREKYSISPASHAPFRTAIECVSAVQFMRPKWRMDSKLAKFVNHVMNAKPQKVSLTDATPGNNLFGTKNGDAFSAVGFQDMLPEAERLLVGEILDTITFVDCSGYQWKPGCPAPTTLADFHFVPKRYHGAVISIDRQGCAQCHSGSLISARRHHVDRIGWGRGNEEDNLSFHPFDPKLLTDDANPEIRLRPEWEENDLVAVYDRRIHPDAIYHRMRKNV